MKKFKEYSDFDLAKINSQILDVWKKENLFQESILSRSKSKPFVFYEGPPSANGMPGIHHVMGRTIKDLFCRYKTLRGFKVERKAGWDAHGLPVELSVEKELGITKDDITKSISISEYNMYCKKTVMKYTSSWNDLTEKMGYWVDMENPYITYNSKYIESVWFLLKCLFEKNLIYKGYAIQPYSPAAGTGLSSHELNMPGCYKDVTDTSVFALFKIIGDCRLGGLCGEDVFLVAWTTTPWTLPANTALAVGKKIKYSLIKTFNPYTKKIINIVCAQKLIPLVLKNFTPVSSAQDLVFDKKQTPYFLLDSFLGEELLGLRYDQLLKYCQPYEKKENAFVVVSGDFVNTDGGTGIVHMAPTFGADDKLVAEKNNIPGMLVLDKKKQPIPIVNKKGQYIDCLGEFSGRFVKKDFSEKENSSLDVDIAIKLKSLGLVFRIEKYKHSYPHCWRTDKPVLYYPLNSWFIKTSSQKEKMLKNNESVFWQPESTGVGRFKNWLEGLNDWNLSRSRFWGTPIPIWKTKNENEVVCFGSVKDLFLACERSVEVGFMKKNPLEKFKINDMSDQNYNAIDLHKHVVDNIVLCSDSGQKMYRDPDLIDVWFDSGAMPFAQLHYPFENKKLIDGGGAFPADFIAEGVDQTRGWFFTLHAISSMCFDSVAFKSVISNGLVLDSEGQKMSKRLGNAVDPFILINKFGADPVRWYMLTNANPWENIKFNISGVDEVKRKFFGTLFNTYSFFTLYANIDGFCYKEKSTPFKKRALLDRWILSELAVLVSDCEKAYESLNATKAARDIQSFVINNLSNWYVRLCRRRFWKSLYGFEKVCAFQTLYECLLVVSKIASPIAPFYTDRLFRDLEFVKEKPAASVHTSFWPKKSDFEKDIGLIKKMHTIQSIVSLGLSLRKKLKIRVRQPLSVVSVAMGGGEELADSDDFLDILKTELNVKSVRFVTQSSSFVEKKLSPNFPVLGKKHGALMKELVVLISRFKKEDVVFFEKNKQIGLDLGKKKIVLFEEDLVFKTSPVPGWSVASDGVVTVALDTKINNELLMEGISREFVNRVQNMRKVAGFNVVDFIDVFVFCDTKTKTSIKENLKHVMSEVMGKSVVFEKKKTNISEEVEINGSKVYIAIKLNPHNG